MNRNIIPEKKKSTLSKKQVLWKSALQKKLTLNLALQKGASNCLSELTLRKNNFFLNKSGIKDGLYLRYGRKPPNFPDTCPYGQSFKLTPSLLSPKRRYTHLKQKSF